MKWELVTLGLGWGQYRQTRNQYHNTYLEPLVPADKSQSKILFDLQTQPKSANPIVNQQNVPNSALQVQPTLSILQQHPSQSHQKPSLFLDTTIDQTDFVVFPELYPELKKKKSIAKRTYFTKLGKEKNRLSMKRKRETRKYKEWFITNKALFEIQESGQFTTEQMEEHYEKFTKEIKSTVLDSNHSDTVKSEEGTQYGEKTQGKGNKESKILGFLEEEAQSEGEGYKIEKYDPFK